MSKSEATLQVVMTELTPKINSLEETFATKVQSFFETCFTKSSNADKFANCVYDGTEKIKREQELFEHRLSFLSLTADKCVESKAADLCQKEALASGNDIISNYSKFIEKL